MNNVIVIMLCLSASVGFASEKFVACKDAGSSQYNIVMGITAGEIDSSATVEEGFRTLYKIDIPATEISQRYDSAMDTNYGYYIQFTNSEDEIRVRTWISGNDSDNYFPQISARPTECVELTEAPKSIEVNAKSVKKSLKVIVF